MITFDILVESELWAHKIQDINTITERVKPHIDGLSADTQICSLVFTDNNSIQQLNKEFRDKDKPTNVLSFAVESDEFDYLFDQTEKTIGEIVLAYETIDQESQDQKKTFESHLTHLIIHGYLHLSGYDHATEEEAEIMETLEIKILSALGIENPYSHQNFIS